MTEAGRSDLETQLLVEMVESVGVGVAIYGDDGRYRYVNEAYADMLGTDRESLTGMALWEIVPGFERDRFEGYWRSFGEQETRVTETEHVVDGTVVPVSTLTTRRCIAGEPYNFGTIRDITDRKRREQELKDKNERLEAFAGIVSHDLRNPLSVAKGYLELLKSDVENDEIELIESALDRMDILIEDLLTLAREGRSVSDSEVVSLSDVAADAWRQIDAGDATLENDSEVTVLADRNRLQQLLENLFRNSIDHTDSPVTIRIGTLDGRTGFYVADDGPGISESKRQQVFEPTYSTDDEGTGFGLAIVNEIASAHGWSVRVTDADGGGARFEFTGTDSMPEQ